MASPTNRELLQALLEQSRRNAEEIASLVAEVKALREEVRGNSASIDRLGVIVLGSDGDGLIDRVDKLDGAVRGSPNGSNLGICARINQLEKSIASMQRVTWLIVTAFLGQLISLGLRAVLQIAPSILK